MRDGGWAWAAASPWEGEHARVIDMRGLGILVVVMACGVGYGQTVELRVDVGAGRHAINPQVYGIVSYDLDPKFAAEVKVPNVRWGGDGTTQYNWQVDSTNAGFDWYFMSGGEAGAGTVVPGGSADKMIATYRAVGAEVLMTVPIIPMVNKSAEVGCSFPVAVYGPQQSVNPYVHPKGGDCGNSLTKDGRQLADKDVYANHVDNSVVLQRGWVEHMVGRFGTAAKGGVRFYQLDNEPDGWGNTHRDVLPQGAPYSEIVRLGQQYAAMIKEVDPGAVVMGPSDFTLGGWVGDPAKQDGLLAGQYYLRAMAAYDKVHGGRLVDYFDEHYYPVFTDAASQMASTRTLWDAGYDGGTWVEKDVLHGPMRLIPRFREWIAAYDPGAGLAFSEYSIDSGKRQISDALAEAEVLGIFGREGVDFANMWSAPKPGDPIAFAFRLYRNYDGKGGMFGETAVRATSSDEARLSVFAAERGDGALTIIVLNKTAGEIVAGVSVEGFKGRRGRVFEYSGAAMSGIVRRGDWVVGKGGVRRGFPGYSATVIEVGGK
jgi:hypothetical protein